MRKCLFLALLTICVLPLGLHAQNTFDLETDTACVGQPIHLKPHLMNGSSYYWGFCSGYLQSDPLLTNLGAGFGFSSPSAVDIARDGNNFYGFVINEPTRQLMRLNFGNSLANVPTVTDFGSLDNSLSSSPNSLFIMKDSGRWYLFVCGGRNAPASISRFDFGTSLGNVPNGVNMGNPGGLLADPRGIFVAKQDDVYYGFVVNATNNRLIRLNFGKNISRTPTATVVNTIGITLNGPRDIAPIYEAGSWYFFVVNLTGNSIIRLNFGNTLSNTPVGTQVAGFMGTRLDQPSGISMIRDCGTYYAYITNRNADEVLRYNVSLTGTWSLSQAYGNNPTFNDPSDISHIVRYQDSLFSFVVNATGNNLVRLTFPQCHNTDIQSSTSAIPPTYRYTAPGLYNIYLAVNEGEPGMSVSCRQILVHAVPPITLAHDTLICQGDTIAISATSQNALNYYYSPNYNIGDTQGRVVYIDPLVSTNYSVRIPYRDGCVVDTVIKIAVSSVHADAGPDRTLLDGASTILGGPNTYTGDNRYIYQWFPVTYLSDPFALNPTATPRTSLTYYLKVTNNDRCFSIDTVNVTVDCNDFNLPNAFAPENLHGSPRSYGLLNKKVEQLNYFRIFDRWGREVFSTTDKTKEWDGNVNGSPAPFGVYVWEADGFCEVTQKRVHRSGNVTLIR